MMIALARAMKASMTRVLTSVQMASFLNPRLCQELVRSTGHRPVACSGAGLPLLVNCSWQPISSSSSRVFAES